MTEAEMNSDQTATSQSYARRLEAVWDAIEAYASANATIGFNLVHTYPGHDQRRADHNLRLTATEKRHAVEVALKELGSSDGG